jgi:hypothetical protein
MVQNHFHGDAHLKTDHAAGLDSRRCKILDSGFTADAEHQALLKIEDSL